MEYRNLGRTGVKVSKLCLGCMNFGGRADEQTSAAIIDQAIDAGVNFIDTANVYGHDPANFKEGRGRSEEIVGRALKQGGKRERVVLATKSYFPIREGDPNNSGNSRRHIIEQCEASLKRLQTDYIDLFQLHHPSLDIPIDETLRALDDLVRAGKVRYIGTSAFGAWQIVESLWVAKEYHLNRFVCEQPPYNLLDRRVERELVPMAQTYGIAIIPWSPLAGGFLTGKYRPDAPPADSRFETFWRGPRSTHYTPQAFALVEALGGLAQEKGCTLSQYALAWCAQQPAVTSPIIGPRTPAQLEDNLGALEISLDAEELKRVDELAPPGRVTVPYYGYDGFAWTTFGPHSQRW